MTRNKRFSIVSVLIAVCAVQSGPVLAQVDADAAQSLAKKGNCFKCHAIEKRKKAPSYREIAAKQKVRPNALEELYRHMHGEALVKTDEGDEPHAPPPDASKAEKENLIRWILSL